MKIEEIKPYSKQGHKSEQVEQMFDSIAPAYDFMNRAMTLGIDKWWRKVATKAVRKAQPEHILDVATGTGDFAINLLQRVKPNRGIIGIDLAQGMLNIAKQKADKAKLNNIEFLQADCLNLPFDNNQFDAVTVAFGVRNFENLTEGFLQMHRVMTCGGLLCVLELSTPRNPIVKFFYDIYTMHIIPAMGALKSGDRNAYRYLPQSIAAVPQGEQMLDIMRKAGFSDCTYQTLTLGTCTLYLAKKL